MHSYATTATGAMTIETGRPGKRCTHCGKKHRDWFAVGRCAWRGSLWLHGCPPKDGDCYALLSYCSPGLSITLHDSAGKAVANKQAIDESGCGGRCTGAHMIFRMI